MKILWTVSNWKRTGPVEPSLSLASALAQRGHDLVAAVGRHPPGEGNTAEEVLVQCGLRRAVPEARLAKHAFFLRDRGDVRLLAAHLLAERPDVVVTTLDNDHRLAVRAAGRAAGRGVRVPVVRLWFSDGTVPSHRRDRNALRQAARVVVFGEAPARTLAGLGLPAERVVRTGAPLDVEGLRAVAPSREEARQLLGLAEGVFALGIVARLQRHRRFELLWEAASLLKREGFAFRFLVVGRGTWQEEVAFGPVTEQGLEDVVVFTGYLRGSQYAGAFAAMDGQLLLVPGSDPTCRAVREGMALGIPSLVTARGLLPSIVADGVTGFVVEESAEGIADGVRRLAADPARRAAMGRAAAERSEQFSLRRVAAAVEGALRDAAAATTRGGDDAGTRGSAQAPRLRGGYDAKS